MLEKHLNFKQTAAECGLTQSALSQNLSNLEKVLGKTLIIRNRGVVEFTDIGRQLVEKSRSVFGTLEQMASLIQDDAIKGTIRLGAYESLAITIVPELLKTMELSFPHLKLDLYTGRSSDLVRDVRAGKLDLALVITEEQETQLDVDEIAPQYLGLFVSKEVQKEYSWEHFLEEKGLATIGASRSGHFAFYNQFLKTIPMDYKTCLSSGSFETIREVTAKGCCVGLLPYLVSKGESGLVKIWPEQDEHIGRHCIKLFSRSASNQDFKRFFIQLLDRLLQDPLG